MRNDLNSFLFSTPEMSRVFSAENQLHTMMRFEWALAAALESQGLAAPGSEATLAGLIEARFVNFEQLEQQARNDGNIAISFVRQLTTEVTSRNPRAAAAIHLGATSQDVLDTALVLQMREGLKMLQHAIERLCHALTNLVRNHRATLITGRTWLQPGPPTTFGMKLAGTLVAIRRHQSRLNAAAGRALVLQFGGAVGTLSALGAAGVRVSAKLAEILELPEPELPWHTQRDALVEIVEVLANLTGSLAKFAKDIALLMQPEIAEVSEATAENRGGSSTMPHKHNPVGCAAVIAAHGRMPGLVVTILKATPQEHERGLGLWQLEWETVPEAFRLTAAALRSASEIAEGLVVDSKRMKSNFDALLGVNMAEAVSSALAQKMPRNEANELLRKAAACALAEKVHLGTVLKSMPEVASQLAPDAIDQLIVGASYLGSAQRFIARALGEPDAND